MKRTIISAILLTVFIAAAGFIFSPGEPSAKEVMLPDHVCVYLNGVPCMNAVVTIGPYQGNTSGDGCASFNIDSGTYCVSVTYKQYHNCVVKTFTGSPDLVTVNLSSGSCDCPDM
jgi:hypothetical protein